MPHLTPRQKEILLLTAAGYNHAQIAYRLTLSPHTVNRHIQNILLLLHADNVQHAIALALTKSIIACHEILPKSVRKDGSI